jgi:hypothetical protein
MKHRLGSNAITYVLPKLVPDCEIACSSFDPTNIARSFASLRQPATFRAWAAGSRVISPSNNRQMPNGLLSFSSSGSAEGGNPW